MNLDSPNLGVTKGGQRAERPTSTDTEEFARQQAIKQIEKRRNLLRRGPK